MAATTTTHGGSTLPDGHGSSQLLTPLAPMLLAQLATA